MPKSLLTLPEFDGEKVVLDNDPRLGVAGPAGPQGEPGPAGADGGPLPIRDQSTIGSLVPNYLHLTTAPMVVMPTGQADLTMVAVKKTSASGTVVINAGSGMTIESAASFTISERNQVATFELLGSDWKLVNVAVAAGVPAGGTAGQVLAKNSATDHDATWTTPAAGGGGGFVSSMKWGID